MFQKSRIINFSKLNRSTDIFPRIYAVNQQNWVEVYANRWMLLENYRKHVFEQKFLKKNNKFFQNLSPVFWKGYGRSFSGIRRLLLKSSENSKINTVCLANVFYVFKFVKIQARMRRLVLIKWIDPEISKSKLNFLFCRAFSIEPFHSVYFIQKIYKNSIGNFKYIYFWTNPTPLPDIGRHGRFSWLFFFIICIPILIKDNIVKTVSITKIEKVDNKEIADKNTFFYKSDPFKKVFFYSELRWWRIYFNRGIKRLTKFKFFKYAMRWVSLCVTFKKLKKFVSPRLQLSKKKINNILTWPTIDHKFSTRLLFLKNLRASRFPLRIQRNLVGCFFKYSGFCRSFEKLKNFELTCLDKIDIYLLFYRMCIYQHELTYHQSYFNSVNFFFHDFKHLSIFLYFYVFIFYLFNFTTSLIDPYFINKIWIFYEFFKRIEIGINDQLTKTFFSPSKEIIMLSSLLFLNKYKTSIVIILTQIILLLFIIKNNKKFSYSRGLFVLPTVEHYSPYLIWKTTLHSEFFKLIQNYSYFYNVDTAKKINKNRSLKFNKSDLLYLKYFCYRLRFNLKENKLQEIIPSIFFLSSYFIKCAFKVYKYLWGDEASFFIKASIYVLFKTIKPIFYSHYFLLREYHQNKRFSIKKNSKYKFFLSVNPFFKFLKVKKNFTISSIFKKPECLSIDDINSEIRDVLEFDYFFYSRLYNEILFIDSYLLLLFFFINLILSIDNNFYFYSFIFDYLEDRWNPEIDDFDDEYLLDWL